MNDVLLDLRFAIRRLTRSPAYAAMTLVMLILGIAVSISMFSVLRGIVYSGLPYPESGEVVLLYAANPQQDASRALLAPAEASAFSAASTTLQSVGYFTWSGATLIDDGRPREVFSNLVSPGFFPALGMQPHLGRWLDEEDSRLERDVAVISFTEWHRVFGGDRNVLGRGLQLQDGRVLEVVGVMPAEFAFPSEDVAVWRPLSPRQLPDAPAVALNARFLEAVARLAPGSTIDQAREELQRIADNLLASHGMADAGWRIQADRLIDVLVGDVRNVLFASFSVALLVLLIACANVAILADARQLARSHENALLQSLGAPRERVYRTVVLELLTLSALAVAAGIVLAATSMRLLQRALESHLPRTESIGIDAGVVAFAALLGLLVPLVSILTGSLKLRGSAADAIRGSGKGVIGRGSRRLRMMPAVGVALALISLSAAAALALSLINLRNVDPGFRTEGIQAVQLFRSGDPDEQRRFQESATERLAGIPGVRRVETTSAAPLSGIGAASVAMSVRGSDRSEPSQVGLRRVSHGYLDLVGVDIIAGRGLVTSDHASAEPVAVVSRSLANREFGDADAVGRMVELQLGRGDARVFRVVGVSEDIRNDGLRSPPAPEVLIPFAQAPWAGMTFLLDTGGAIHGIHEASLEAIWAVDPRQAVTREFTLDEELANQLGTANVFAGTVGIFAVLALVLGVTGVYAVASQQQQRRVKEFGVRLALGARPATLAGQVLAEAARTAALGLAAGLAGAWLVLGFMREQLFGVEPLLPWVLVVGCVVIALSSIAASLLPAMRAAYVDPMNALRQE